MSLWLPLPILTLLVSLKFSHQQSANNQEPNSDVYRLKHLFSALRVFRTRFRSGQFILDLITNIAKDLHLGLWDITGLDDLHSDQPVEGEFEVETLTRAAKMIDEGISSDLTGSSDR